MAAAGAAPQRSRVARTRAHVCGACSFVFYLDPKVAACTIFLMDGGIVLVRRSIEPQIGKWVFPGGFVDRAIR